MQPALGNTLSYCKPGYCLYTNNIGNLDCGAFSNNLADLRFGKLLSGHNCVIDSNALAAVIIECADYFCIYFDAANNVWSCKALSSTNPLFAARDLVTG